MLQKIVPLVTKILTIKTEKTRLTKLTANIYRHFMLSWKNLYKMVLSSLNISGAQKSNVR